MGGDSTDQPGLCAQLSGEVLASGLALGIESWPAVSGGGGGQGAAGGRVLPVWAPK